MEPITVDEAKAHLLIVDDVSQDALIAHYITAAREWVENHTGKILVRRSITEHRDRFGAYVELYKGPVVSITEVSYTGTDGAATPYLGAVARLERNPVRIYPAADGAWPALGRHGSVSVTYVAGYAATEVPKALTVAVLMLVGHWYAVREAVNVGNIVAEMPFSVESLCRPFRNVGLG